MLALMFGLQGCAIWGIEFGVHRTVMVEKAPYRVVVSGDIQPEDYAETKRLLDFLHNQKYRDRNFTDVTVAVNGSQNTSHTNYYTNNTNSESTPDSSSNTSSEGD